MGRLSITELKAMKERGEKIPMITAYDYPTAKLVEAAGIPIILVGDSLGMVVLGYETTLPVTLEDMIHHGKAVVRGTEQAIVVVDMPFMSYQVSPEDALRNAGRLIKETGATAVKLEGADGVADTVARLVSAGIPVMGHLGLTPQSVNQLGGYRLQGKTPAAVVKIINDAMALERAGAFAIVLETIPAFAAKQITGKLSVPTIGIGAGPYCDGQVQVVHDFLGLYPDFLPRHARRFADLSVVIQDAVRDYVTQVHDGSFPSAKESFGLEKARKALAPPEDAELTPYGGVTAHARPSEDRSRLMIVAPTIAEVRAWRRTVPGPVGLVPTMGFLHAGHLSLVEAARRENASVVASIFVNPAQFGPQEDLASYPRDPERDLALLAAAGTDLVFIPPPEVVYPPAFDTWVTPGTVAEPLEGRARPGHFRGVATVVLKLFNIVQPDRAYFGRKDAQQLRVISKMVEDLDAPVQVIGLPTVREPDGLAMSSRNVYLRPEERIAALVLHRALAHAAALWVAGERSPATLRAAITDLISSEPLARADYVSVADSVTLVELEQPAKTALASVAVRVGRARLIDNESLGC